MVIDNTHFQSLSFIITTTKKGNRLGNSDLCRPQTSMFTWGSVIAQTTEAEIAGTKSIGLRT